MKTTALRAIAIGSIVGASSLGLVSCANNLTCAPGTHQQDNECVADVVDASAGTDGPVGGGASCGPNTMLDTATNKCVLAQSACQAGTTFDQTAGACKIVQNFGTKIFSSPLNQVWGRLAYMNPNPPDGGSAFSPLGDRYHITATTVPDTASMYLLSGVTVGFTPGTTLPVHWETGNVSSTLPAQDHVITVGEWKTCNGSWAVYNNPPSGKKNYNIVIDLAGCPPYTILSVWMVASLDGTFPMIVDAFPAGGIPNSFEVGQNGQAHFEREVDPAKWFKSGIAVNGNAHNPSLGMGMIPDLNTYPNAAIYPSVQLHTSGQSNGNVGNCEKDANGNCLTPPSPNIFLPGRPNIDATLTHDAVKCTGCPGSPIPLSMLQPY
jgi:hypothetical protein